MRMFILRTAALSTALIISAGAYAARSEQMATAMRPSAPVGSLHAQATSSPGAHPVLGAGAKTAPGAAPARHVGIAPANGAVDARGALEAPIAPNTAPCDTSLANNKC